MFRCPQVQFLPLGLAGWRQHHEAKNLLNQPLGSLGSNPSAVQALGSYLYPRKVLRLPAIKGQPGDPGALPCHCSGRETEA